MYIIIGEIEICFNWFKKIYERVWKCGEDWVFSKFNLEDSV